MMEEASPTSSPTASRHDSSSAMHSILVSGSPPTNPEQLAAQQAEQEKLTPKPAAKPAEPQAEEATPAAAENELTTGLWGLWNNAVSSSSSLMKSAVGSAQSTAQRFQEATKQVDGQFLGGLLNKTKAGAKAAVDATLRPLGLSGGEGINVVLTSAAFPKVNAVREALDRVFGFGSQLRAVPVPSGVANQPVGFVAGKQGAENRIEELSKLEDGVREGEVAISVENFIIEATPGHWFDMAYVVLMDDQNDIQLDTISQAVGVPHPFPAEARKATSPSYEFKSTGFSVTVGQLMKQQRPEIDDANWHLEEACVGRNQLVHVAVLVLFGQYRKALQRKAAAVAAAAAAPAQ